MRRDFISLSALMVMCFLALGSFDTGEEKRPGATSNVSKPYSTPKPTPFSTPETTPLYYRKAQGQLVPAVSIYLEEYFPESGMARIRVENNTNITVAAIYGEIRFMNAKNELLAWYQPSQFTLKRHYGYGYDPYDYKDCYLSAGELFITTIKLHISRKSERMYGNDIPIQYTIWNPTQIYFSNGYITKY